MMQDDSANDEAISNSEQDIQQVMSPIITNNDHHASKITSSSEGEENLNTNKLGESVLEELLKQQQQDEQQKKDAKPEYVDRMIIYNGEITGKVPSTDLDSTVEKIQSMLLEEGGEESYLCIKSFSQLLDCANEDGDSMG